uniref:Uncharacterized protein n=1 Tax=Amphimedon queenslandica TaxID=400682 RepID=A0A1X7V215_AMPQE
MTIISQLLVELSVQFLVEFPVRLLVKLRVKERQGRINKLWSQKMRMKVGKRNKGRTQSVKRKRNSIYHQQRDL